MNWLAVLIVIGTTAGATTVLGEAIEAFNEDRYGWFITHAVIMVALIMFGSVNMWQVVT